MVICSLCALRNWERRQDGGIPRLLRKADKEHDIQQAIKP